MNYREILNCREALVEKLKNNDIKCPECNCNKIGIDNWGMFKGEADWFYYCKECDSTFVV